MVFYKRRISFGEVDPIYPKEYSSHRYGYVCDTWAGQLGKDGMEVKRDSSGTFLNITPTRDNLSDVGAFTDPDKKCAWDENAGTAIEGLSQALVKLRDALSPFEKAVYSAGKGQGGSGEAVSVFRQTFEGFQGYFAREVFRPNRDVCLAFGAKLYDMAKNLISFTESMAAAAQKEQNNREDAKKVYAAHYDWFMRHKKWEESYDRFLDCSHGSNCKLCSAPKYPEPQLSEEMKQPETEPFPTQVGGGMEGQIFSRKDDATRGSNETVTSAIPSNLKKWGEWWRPHCEDIKNAAQAVKKAYEEGGFPSAPTGDQAGTQKFSPGWKWGQIDGLYSTSDAASVDLLTAVTQFCNDNTRDADMLDFVAALFIEAEKHGINTLDYKAINDKLRVKFGADYASRDVPPIADLNFVGVEPSTGYANDPVNVATGALTEVETDIRFAGSAESFKVVRTYNAGDKKGGVFGAGWFSVLDEHLEVSPSEVGWRRADGALVQFAENPASNGVSEEIEADSRPYWLTYSDIPAVFANSGELGIESSKVFCISDNVGAARIFDREGILLGFAGAVPGDSVLCQRNEQGRIERLVHASGRYIACEYGSDSFVSRVYTSDEREAIYSYIDNHLVSVTSPLGVREYVWNEEVGILERTTDESGIVLMENTFDSEGRVSRQKTPDGRTVEFVYLPSGVTLVRDADADNDSARVDRWVSDKDTRLVGVVDSHGSQMSISRDRFGNPVNVNDREDQETLRVFDSRSRLSLQVTPEGVRTSFEWDEWDRCTRITREIPSSNSVIVRSASDEAIANTSSVVEETVFTYSVPDQTNGLIVRTPVSVTDSEGVTYTFEHDESGRVAAMSVGSRYCLAFTYDEKTGDLISITNALGQTVSLTYDATGNITSFTSPSGALTQFEWDNAGHAVKRIDPDGAVHSSSYENNRLVSQIAPDGGTTTYTYGDNGKIVSITNSLGQETKLTHDDQGNTNTITTPDGNTWQTLYDSMSRLTKILTPTGDEWAYGYTANGDLESITSPAGLISTLSKTLFNGGAQVEGTTSAPTSATADNSSVVESDAKQSQHGTVILDALGRPVKVLSPDGDILETRVYDKAGRLAEALDAEAGLTRYEYNELGIVSRIINPDETVTEFTYDEAARLVRKSYSSAEFEDYSYDADGRVVAVVNQDGYEETFTYDACGRVTSHTTPQGETTAYSYDVCGRTTSITDGLHGTRTFTYDVAGKLVSATDANGNTTTYTYTANGQLESVTAPDGGVRRFEYDCYGNMTKETDPLGRSETRAYDSIGNLLSLTRADNTGLKYEYDATGRLLEIENHKGEPLATYDYGTSDRTITITDSLAHTRHKLVFDRLGRLTSKTTGDTTVAYTYDKSGSRESMSITRHGDDKPAVVTYGYDSAGELAEVTHSTFGVLNPLMQEAGLASDATVSYDDESGRISRIVTDTSDVSYEYDTAGQLAVLTDNHTGENTVYSYDECGRLTTITDGEGETRFTYNQAGEIVSRVMPDGTAITYAYDACGRRVSETMSDASIRKFEWDNLGYLARVTSSSLRGEDATETVSLSHDIFGNLATLTHKEETTRFVWDTDADVPALLRVGNDDVFTALGHTAYGTPSANTGWLSHGWREARPTNPANPWGLPPEIASSALGGLPRNDGMMLPWNVLLGGSVSVFGMELMGARTYDPVTHGFLSVDPLSPTTGMPYANNPYEYAGNNPLAMLDPLGLSALTDEQFQAMYGTYSENLESTKSNPSWWDEYGDWIVGGVAFVAGVVLVATGVGGPAGLALMSFGGDVLVQKITTGSVNYGDAIVSGAFGIAGGPVAIASKAGKFAKMYNKIDNLNSPVLRQGGKALAKGTENAIDSGVEEYAKQAANNPNKFFSVEGQKELVKEAGKGAVTGGATGGIKAGVKTKNIAPDPKKYNVVDDVKHVKDDAKHAGLPKTARAEKKNLDETAEEARKKARHYEGQKSGSGKPKGSSEKEARKNTRKQATAASASLERRELRNAQANDIVKDDLKKLAEEGHVALSESSTHSPMPAEAKAVWGAVDDTFVDVTVGAVSGDSIESVVGDIIDDAVDKGADLVDHKIQSARAPKKSTVGVGDNFSAGGGKGGGGGAF